MSKYLITAVKFSFLCFYVIVCNIITNDAFLLDYLYATIIGNLSKRRFCQHGFINFNSFTYTPFLIDFRKKIWI
jgi:hypothetical protein